MLEMAFDSALQKVEQIWIHFQCFEDSCSNLKFQGYLLPFLFLSENSFHHPLIGKGEVAWMQSLGLKRGESNQMYERPNIQQIALVFPWAQVVALLFLQPFQALSTIILLG